MTPSEAAGVFARRGWLSRQPKDFRDQFLAGAEFQEAAAGESIYALGDPPGGLYGLAAGYIDVLIAPGPLPPMLAHVAGPGWWIGDSALITRTERRVGLLARTKVTVAYVSERAVQQMAADDPAIWRRVAGITVGHLEDVLSFAACLATSDLRLRLLATLDRLVGSQEPSEQTVELPIGRQQLGEIAGLSRNTVGKLLADLASSEIVERRYGGLVIHRDRLRAALDN